MPSVKVGMQMKGIARLNRKLATLRRVTTARKVMKGALREAGKFLLKDIRCRAPKRKRDVLFEHLEGGGKRGALKRSIRLKVGHKGSGVFAVVGPVVNEGERMPSRYAHLVEFGTQPHPQFRLKMLHPGSSPQPFIQPALDENQNKIFKIYKRALKLGVVEEARRA